MIGYVILVLSYFGPLAMEGLVLSTHDGDVAAEWWWKRAYLGEVLREGGLPILNPYNAANSPFLASSQMAVFYPLNWFSAVLPPTLFLNMQTILHFWAGLAAMHLLARRMGLSSPAAGVAALVFGFSGFAIQHWWTGHLVFVTAWPYTPLAVLAWMALQSAAPTGRGWLVPACGLAFFVAMQLFSGHPQICYFTLLLLMLLHCGWIFYGLTRSRAGLPKRPSFQAAVGRGTLRLALAGALAAGMVAVQALPTYLVSRDSSRGEDVPLQALQINSLPLNHTLLLGVPEAFGGTRGTIYLAQSKGYLRTYPELCIFVGAVTLVLAAGALLAGGARGTGVRWTLVVLAVLSWWLSLGVYGGLHGTLTGVLPGLKLFRCPARFGYLMGFAFALLAGLGLDRSVWLARPRARLHRALKAILLVESALLLAFLAFLAVVYTQGPLSPIYRRILQTLDFPFPLESAGQRFFLTYQSVFVSSSLRGGMIAAAALALLSLLLVPKYRRSVPWLIVLVLTAELLRFALPWRTGFRVETFFWPKQVETLLRSAGPRWRLGSFAMNADFSQALLRRVRHVWSVDVLTAKRYSDALALSQNQDPSWLPLWMQQRRSSPFTRALGMRYLLAPVGQTPAPSSHWKLLLQSGKWAVYEDPMALPRGYTVRAAEKVTSDRIAREVNSPAFDPSRSLLLIEAPPAGFSGENRNMETEEEEDTVSVKRDDPEAFEAGVEMKRPGWFVLMDQHLPGWTATVNGTVARLYLANGIGRALPLPAGTHTVSMRYEAPGLEAGAWLTAMAWVIWAGGLAAGAGTSRHRRSDATSRTA